MANKQRTPSRSVLAYVAFIDLAALVVAIRITSVDWGDKLWPLGLLVGLSLLAGLRSVKLPVLKAELSANHPFILLALAAIGPRAAMLVAVCGVLPTWSKSKPHQFAFNLGSLALSAAAAALAFLACGGSIGAPAASLVGPLAAAMAAYCLCNSLLVAGAISLQSGASMFATWRGLLRHFALSFATGWTVSVAMVAAFSELLPWWALLAVPASVALVGFYRALSLKLQGDAADKHAAATARVSGAA